MLNSHYSQNQQHNSGLVMPSVRLIVGIACILLALFFNIKFVADGQSGAAILSTIVFCVSMEVCKIFFSADFFFYVETRQSSKALMSATLTAILFLLSISGGIYALMINPTTQQATLQQADTRNDTLQKQIAAKQAQLDKCNPNYVSKCITPLNAELTSLQGQLSAAMTENKALSDARGSSLFWQKLADYMGVNADNLQLGYALMRSVLIDLLGLILLSQYSAIKRLQSDYSDYSAMRNDDITKQDNAAMLAKIEALEAELEKSKLEKKL